MSVKLQVETFEVEDADKSRMEISEQDETRIVELIETLELEGQKELLSRDDDSGASTVIPFQVLDTATKNQWDAVCPHHVELGSYSGELIPLRILEVLALTKEREFFDKAMIWSRTSDYEDPVVIGVVKGGSGVNDKYYLLARWGLDLFPIEELYERAAEALKAKWVAKRDEWLEKCQSFNMDANVRKFLLDGGLGVGEKVGVEMGLKNGL